MSSEQPLWYKYLNETPIDLKNVQIGDKYFMSSGDGEPTGLVTVSSDNIRYGIHVNYDDNQISPTVIFPSTSGPKYYDKNKKLYKIIEGGRRTRQNKKSRKARKSRRKHARRTGRRI